ncbi:MAG: InlB B-repeat-containing protein, partial [Bacteroidota bacterium]
MKQKMTFLCIVLFLLGIGMEMNSQSVSLPTDPDRVTLTTSSEGITTVTTAEGELLRGVAILFRRAAWVDNYSTYSYWFDENYYKTLADSGVNLFRIGLYDPGMNQFEDACSQNWPVTDFNNPDHVADYLGRLDTIVDYCSKYGIYVDINFHQTPGSNDPNGYYGAFCDPDANNMSYIKELWTVTAPYFKDRTHVFYEPVNEPVKWWPYSYLEASQDYHIDSLAVIFKLVADLAPETHLSLFTFPNCTCSWGGCEVGMKDVVDEYKSRYPNDVNWDNVTIAYHPYTTGGTSDPILELASAYAVFDSESNYPSNSELNDAGYPNVTNGSSQRSESMDNELLVMETNERLGISWNVWSSGSTEQFEANWAGIILPDARAKDYIWINQGPKYDLTIVADSDKGSVTPSGGSYTENTNVSLKATGELGYKFDKWTGDLTGTENPKSITMDSDKSVTANFVPVTTYTLTTSADPTDGGSVSPSGSNDYDEDTDVEVIATANT